MYEKKKILVETAFQQAEKELGKENQSKSYLASYISDLFQEKYGSAKDERTFVRYYKELIEDKKDRYIDEITKDQLSKYIGYIDYEDFCKNFTFTRKINESTTLRFTIDDDEHSVTGKKGSSFNFTLLNKPVFNLQEFLSKQSNLGIIGVIICSSLVVGNKIYIERISTKECMYWNGKEYIPEDCKNTRHRLIAIDTKLVDNFKKITRPDTIKSKKGIWYSKKNNVVDFFTADGMNPENNAELHELSDHMLEKYILSKNSVEE